MWHFVPNRPVQWRGEKVIATANKKRRKGEEAKVALLTAGENRFRDVIFHSRRKRSNAPFPYDPHVCVCVCVVCTFVCVSSGCLQYRANVDRLRPDSRNTNGPAILP